MAYAFAAASSQYLSTASAPADGTPMTIAAWGRTSVSGPFQSMISVGQAITTHRNQLQFGSGAGVDRAVASAFGATATGSASGTSNARNGEWNHGCGVFTSTVLRELFFNGVSEATNTTNIGTQNTFTYANIGARTASNAVSGYFDGSLAEVGIWNVALTADEIASLAKGMTCNLVRPQSLVFYAPLIRDLQDVKGGLAITNNNTATIANHPRVYR